jgi:uncharacterized tellurite resistance protein B-like protein
MMKGNLEIPYLVSLEQAGFDVLYALMLSDGHGDESEFEIIKNYLHTDFVHKSCLFDEKHSFYGECNFTKEYQYLQSLDKNGLFRRFKKAVNSIAEWLKNAPNESKYKKELFDFCLKVIHADQKITPEEAELLEILKKEWHLGTTDKNPS